MIKQTAKRRLLLFVSFAYPFFLFLVSSTLSGCMSVYMKSRQAGVYLKECERPEVGKECSGGRVTGLK